MCRLVLKAAMLPPVAVAMCRLARKAAMLPPVAAAMLPPVAAAMRPCSLALKAEAARVEPAAVATRAPCRLRAFPPLRWGPSGRPRQLRVSFCARQFAGTSHAHLPKLQRSFFGRRGHLLTNDLPPAATVSPNAVRISEGRKVSLRRTRSRTGV